MRRSLVLTVLTVLATAALAAPPAHAASETEIVLQLGWSMTCDQPATCDVSLTGVLCLEHIPGPACTVDPITYRLSAPPIFSNVCFLAIPDSTPNPPLVVHTTSAGDISFKLSVVFERGVIAMVGQSFGTGQAAVLVAAGAITNPLAAACAETPTVVTGTIAYVAL
jgi:hypothetical protein